MTVSGPVGSVPAAAEVDAYLHCADEMHREARYQTERAMRAHDAAANFRHSYAAERAAEMEVLFRLVAEGVARSARPTQTAPSEDGAVREVLSSRGDHSSPSLADADGTRSALLRVRSVPRARTDARAEDDERHWIAGYNAALDRVTAAARIEGTT